MDPSEIEELTEALFTNILGQSAPPGAATTWNGGGQKTPTPGQIIRQFVRSAAYQERFGVRSCWPNGHFYSPVVNPTEAVRAYAQRQREQQTSDIKGINFDLPLMEEIWDTSLPFIRQFNFFDEVISRARRYSPDNPSYPLGDAIFLSAILSRFRPKRIVEVGSGYSSACMVDILDAAEMRTAIWCVEPYPERLKGLLRPMDMSRVTIVESSVQDVPVSLFSELEAGDILFIDSTHVLKTGSDVHFEIFTILPLLADGVIVHFHDCQFPFEYPDKWIAGANYSWNEIYALRAFLMYNNRFSVLFHNSLFASWHHAKIAADVPGFPANPGTGLWIVAGVGGGAAAANGGVSSITPQLPL